MKLLKISIELDEGDNITAFWEELRWFYDSAKICDKYPLIHELMGEIIGELEHSLPPIDR